MGRYTLILTVLFIAACSGGSGSSSTGNSHIPSASETRLMNDRDFVFTGIGYDDSETQTYTEPAGNTFYVDPVNGSGAGDGSEANPWGTLQQVIEGGLIETWNRPEGDPDRVQVNSGAPVKAGDMLVLKEGFHGVVYIREMYNDSPITIRAAANEAAVIKYVRVLSSGNWRFDGLHVTMEQSLSDFENVPLFRVESYEYGRSTGIEVYNSKLYTVSDISNWNITDWNEVALSAMNIDGDNITIRNNFIANIDFGISVGGSFNTISRNTVKNFAGDGMRGNGNDLLFEENLIKNSYDVNDNHDDGFQSFSVNGQPDRERVTLRRNVILNYDDPDRDFIGSLQGIGCFDGFYRNWLVEKNLVIVDHWHGISLYGTTDTVVQNNIVADINTLEPGPPWIMIHDHKDGRPSENVIVRNNIAHTYSLSGNNITNENNREITVEERDTLFVDPDNLDFRLLDPGMLD